MNEATLKLSKEMQPLAAAIDEVITTICGERQGFTLIVFTEGRASYVSNVKREESKAEMEKLLEYWNAGMPDVPAHEIRG